MTVAKVKPHERPLAITNSALVYLFRIVVQLMPVTIKESVSVQLVRIDKGSHTDALPWSNFSRSLSQGTQTSCLGPFGFCVVSSRVLPHWMSDHRSHFHRRLPYPLDQAFRHLYHQIDYGDGPAHAHLPV